MIKKWTVRSIFSALAAICLLSIGIATRAEGEKTIHNGIYAGQIELAGLTEAEASAAIEEFVKQLSQVEITLKGAEGNQVVVTAGELGLFWANPELVSEAVQLGTKGNVVERYKMLKDLEHENKIYPIILDFDLQTINDLLIEECVQYDVEAKDGYLNRKNGEFQIIAGQVGYKLDVETSIDRISECLTMDWDYQPCIIELDVTVEEPKGTVEQLSAVQDVLGTFTTSFASSAEGRAHNVTRGCELVDGVTLYPGEEFSTYNAVGPLSGENGYELGGSYLNGKLVQSYGGGICQVSTTLYNAVLLAELEVTERHNHSLVVTYVDPSDDAAISESAGKDFRFVNNLDYPIYIEGHVKDSRITFTIYGKETRDEGYKVRYESEILDVISPTADVIYVDASQPIGYIVTDSAYTGYKAKLWKIVTQDGAEVSRTQVNSSSYKMVPRSATVGVATLDPLAYEEIMAAIGTGSIDHVKNVIALLTAPPQETPQ